MRGLCHSKKKEREKKKKKEKKECSTTMLGSNRDVGLGHLDYANLRAALRKRLSIVSLRY